MGAVGDGAAAIGAVGIGAAVATGGGDETATAPLLPVVGAGVGGSGVARTASGTGLTVAVMVGRGVLLAGGGAVDCCAIQTKNRTQPSAVPATRASTALVGTRPGRSLTDYCQS
jgi:hypothetical protein